MTLRPRSVRTRLTLWHAAVLTALVCAFSVAIYVFVRVRLFDDLDAHLTRDLATIEATYREGPGELSEAESRAGITRFQVMQGDTVVYRTDDWSKEGLGDSVRLDRAATTSWRSPMGRRYRVLVSTDATHGTAVAADETTLHSTLRTLSIILALGVPFAILLAIAGGWFLAGRLLAPVGRMAERARSITADRLDERLPVDIPDDEFGRLATVFNETLARLQDAFERLRRFTADASHELRTPLTAMRSVGEVSLHSVLEPAAYRDVIGSMLEEVERLTALVESLLTLTRADSRRLPVAQETVDLRAIAASAAEHLRVLAEEKEQTLAVEADGAVTARCDPALLRQGLVNLVDNAIKYTQRKGAIRVGVTRAPSGEAAIEVTDDGPGIGPTHLPHIFERFYRVDPGRGRSDGGVGLGLAIARSTVEASGGRIEVESEQGRGTVFRVLLPPPAALERLPRSAVREQPLDHERPQAQ